MPEQVDILSHISGIWMEQLKQIRFLGAPAGTSSYTVSNINAGTTKTYYLKATISDGTQSATSTITAASTLAVTGVAKQLVMSTLSWSIDTQTTKQLHNGLLLTNADSYTLQVLKGWIPTSGI